MGNGQQYLPQGLAKTQKAWGISWDVLHGHLSLHLHWFTQVSEASPTRQRSIPPEAWSGEKIKQKKASRPWLHIDHAGMATDYLH